MLSFLATRAGTSWFKHFYTMESLDQKAAKPSGDIKKGLN
jgi:hypothetical protein